MTRPALDSVSHSLFIIIVMVWAGQSAGSAQAATRLDYSTLQGSKALAVVPGSSEVRGIAHGQPNDLAASVTALRVCELQRRPAQPSCEILRLNDERITSGAEILAEVPAAPHPLHLWRVQGNSATIYLAGSIHMLKASLYPLPVQYEHAFRASDTLVVEVDVSAYTPMDLQRRTASYTSLESGQQLEGVLPVPLFERLSTRLKSYGMSKTTYNESKPALLMNQLVMLRLLALGYHQQYGIEQHFLGQLDNRQVLELETLEDQLALLFNQPMTLQIQQLRDTLNQEAGIEA
ncbi:MAG: TraB/GumN family protein, partial [Pseudomonadales bacterium]